MKMISVFAVVLVVVAVSQAMEVRVSGTVDTDSAGQEITSCIVTMDKNVHPLGDNYLFIDFDNEGTPDCVQCAPCSRTTSCEQKFKSCEEARRDVYFQEVVPADVEHAAAQ